MAAQKKERVEHTNSTTQTEKSNIVIKELVEAIRHTRKELGNEIEHVTKNSKESCDSSIHTEKMRKVCEKSVSNKNVYRPQKNLEKAVASSQKLCEIHQLTEKIIFIRLQTALLILNDSVEAAKKKEMQEQFVVASDEVRRLSNHSKQIADTIRQMFDITK